MAIATVIAYWGENMKLKGAKGIRTERNGSNETGGNNEARNCIPNKIHIGPHFLAP
jgi:hypothetical protein